MDIPRNLIDQIAQGNCVLFLGSGPSMAAGLPSWPQLLHQMIAWGEKHGINFSDKAEIERFISDDKFLLAAEELVERLGENGFGNFITETFDRPGLTATEVHLLSAQIPFAAQVTTNYDTLSEKGYEAAHNKLPLVFTQEDVQALSQALRTGEFYILKSHGTVDRIETVVLTRKQYRAVMYANPAYRKFLETLFSTKTVLFIGFGLTDPDLIMTLDELQAAFHGYTGTHYALMDENRVSEIERGRFFKDYKIELIPYNPTAVDHPQVREFLKLLLSGVTPSALRHRMGRAKEMLEEADTHYKLVATTEDEFIIKEKFPGASKEKPLPFSVELRFDKKTQEGQEALESWQKHIDTGEEIKIKSPHLSKFVPPEILSRFLPVPTDEMEMTIGPRRSETKIPIKIIIENENGKTQALDHIMLEEIRQGKKEITLSNENQDSPWKIHQVIMREDFKESTFTINFTDDGLNVKQALDGWRFWEALSAGGVVTIEWQETGQRFGHTTIPPGTYQPPDPRLMDLLEALVLIQKRLPVRFESPDNVSFEEATIILAVAEILQTGKADLKPETVVLDSTIGRVAELVQRFADEASATISNYFEDVPITVLGNQVTLGPMTVDRQVHIAPDEFAALKRRVDTAPASESVTVNFSPVEGSSPIARFPEWLPKDEADQLRKLPFVRSATLKSLLRLLFDTAKINGDELDAREFVRLLDDARAQVSDDGEPLNSLSSCTTEELLILFETFVRELSPTAKLDLASELSATGWLPVDKAANLFGVDENLMKAKLQNSKAANHTV